MIRKERENPSKDRYIREGGPVLTRLLVIADKYKDRHRDSAQRWTPGGPVVIRARRRRRR